MEFTNRYSLSAIALTVGFVGMTCPAGEPWVTVTNETASRLGVPMNNPAVTTDDTSEKSYACADVDLDGDLDLVVARKQPWTTTGRRTNVLLMNEGLAEGHAANGVLIDRTTEYATLSTVDGDLGFLTPTNDRDVALADVNNDGYPDIITAPSLTDNEPTHLSHPRIYINLGHDGGAWLGFRYEEARIPVMNQGTTGGPRFVSVSVGDVTGDGFVDLYFTDSDSGGPQILDYNNRLLINDGTGHFVDASLGAMGAVYDYGPFLGVHNFLLSSFGASSAIADMNGDGQLDVIKQTALSAPLHIAILYNNLGNDASEGVFTDYDIIYQKAGYYVQSGDLNGDGLLDLVVVDDGLDRFLINQGNDADGKAIFTNHGFPPPDQGFGGNAAIADFDLDGHPDVYITDVEVEIAGCTRRLKIFRNDGNTPVPAFTLENVIPIDAQTGTHDIAVFDITGDGRPDLVTGRCDGTDVWINQPPDISCRADCAPDLGDGNVGNGVVNIDDVLAVVNAFGTAGGACDTEPVHTNGTYGNGIVNIDDLLGAINAFGPCP
jgi:hypothetical protein